MSLKYGTLPMGDIEQQVAAKCGAKPPRGICLREVHRMQRIGNLLGAIQRYVDANKHVPANWADELCELVDEHNEGK